MPYWYGSQFRYFSQCIMNLSWWCKKWINIVIALLLIFTTISFHSYTENAQRTARIFRDRPQSALDTAIFWTEYVIRHGGAPHLRSAAVELSWYQYLLLDVIAFMLGTILMFLLAVRKLFRLLRNTRKTPKKNKQQWLKPCSRSVALELTQPLTEMSTRNLPGGKCDWSIRLTTSPPSVCQLSRKMWDLRRLITL
jgi:hypothetical protein